MVAVSDTPSSIGERRFGGMIVGAVQHEAAPGLHRAADMHIHVDLIDPDVVAFAGAMLSCFSSSRKLMCGAR